LTIGRGGHENEYNQTTRTPEHWRKYTHGAIIIPSWIKGREITVKGEDGSENARPTQLGAKWEKGAARELTASHQGLAERKKMGLNRKNVRNK